MNYISSCKNKHKMSNAAVLKLIIDIIIDVHSKP